jgi:hypothetical protein
MKGVERTVAKEVGVDSARCVEADSGFRCDLYEAKLQVLAGCRVEHSDSGERSIGAVTSCRRVGDATLRGRA